MLFTNVIKPTHTCNLACKYCYNDDVRGPIMRIDTLERIISETFIYLYSNTPQGKASFIWHGGEPMLARRDFYKKAVEFQKRYSGDIKYENSIQTNGTLINRDWIDFFKENEFKVSISLDGPRKLNDKNRIDHRGRGSYERVIESIEMVIKSGIPLGICFVISADNKNYVDEIYDLISDLKVPFNIIPINKSGGAKETYHEVGLESKEYAESWIKMYERWFDADEDYVYCSDFVFKTRAIMVGKPVDCIGLKSCASSNISIDPVGDVYPCATLSGEKGTCYGNINEQSLSAILTSDLADSYRSRATDPKCKTCKWQHVCNGGCHARAYKFFGDQNMRDYYCHSLFRIYEHIESKLVSKIPDVYKSQHASRKREVVNLNKKEQRL